MPDLPTSTRNRLKFASIGAIGAAMVLLPLGAVLRYQNADLSALVAERAVLDPLTHALAVQRGLLGHRDVAERVLRGRLQLEAERRLRKADVDDALWALQGTLSAGYWVKALRESDTLVQDWRQLAHRVALRQVQVADSLAGHQLLVEQAVQVMDLVSAAAPAGSYARLTHLTQLARLPAAPGSQSDAAADALEAALRAHALDIDQRTAAIQERQAALASTSAALALLLLGLALWTARQRRAAATSPGDAASPAIDTDGVRRSHGRRSADGAAAADVSSQLLQRIRAEAESAQETQPSPQAPRS